MNEYTPYIFSRYPHSINLASIPRLSEMKSISLSTFLSYKFSEDDFEKVWPTAKIILKSDSTLRDWSYSPYTTGTFETAGGHYSFEIYLGGLSTLTTPTHETGFFMLDLSALSPDASESSKK